MKHCSYLTYDDDQIDFTTCNREVVEKMWSPLWVNAIDGPIEVCETCRDRIIKENKGKTPLFYRNDAEVAYMQAMKDGGLLRAGCGGWDVTSYPIGGSFVRPSIDTKLTNLKLLEHKKGWVSGEVESYPGKSGKRTFCVQASHVRLPGQTHV